MSECMRSCVTCINMHKKCDGECERCENSIPRVADEGFPVGNGVFSGRGIGTQCKCLVCDESNGYKYYEEDKEKTKFFK